jgi:ABC-2 type transport system ATP-binding protein
MSDSKKNQKKPVDLEFQSDKSMVKSQNDKSDEQSWSLRIEGLTKCYEQKAVVDNLSLEINRGEVFGLLGPNGAGKSTFLKLIMDITRPTSGIINFSIEDSENKMDEREEISYLGENYSLYPYMTSNEVLDLAAGLYNDPDREWGKRLLEGFSIPLDKKIKYLSRGMKQQVKLAQSLLNQGQVIILDEPTTGLDLIVKNQILDLINRLNKEGKTIIFSSHNMHEVEQIADRVGFIKNGELLALENVDDLPERERRIEFVPQVEVAEEELVITGVTGIERKGDKFSLYYDRNERNILSKLSQIPYFTLNIEKPDLEDVFINIIGGDNNAVKKGD